MDRPEESLDHAAQRFAADCASLIGSAEKLGLAVSGGPDSLALLLLGHRAFAERIAVATVDHGLRAGSAEEARSVAAICASLNVGHTVLPVHVERAGNLQANARTARYRALGEWANRRGIGAIVAGHHADDQAETLLMRLARGAGLRGLAAMKPRAPLPGRQDIPLLRPLLGWRRAELAALVAEAGWIAADDPSNRDPAYERVRLRTALAGAGVDCAPIAASAEHLREAADALDWAVERELASAVRDDGDEATYRAEAPRAVRLEVLRVLVQRLGDEGSPRGSEVARLLDTLERGGTATLGGVKAAAVPDGWRLVRAPPRR